jgi:hypothetical protein
MAYCAFTVHGIFSIGLESSFRYDSDQLHVQIIVCDFHKRYEPARLSVDKFAVLNSHARPASLTPDMSVPLSLLAKKFGCFLGTKISANLGFSEAGRHDLP